MNDSEVVFTVVMVLKCLDQELLGRTQQAFLTGHGYFKGPRASLTKNIPKRIYPNKYTVARFTDCHHRQEQDGEPEPAQGKRHGVSHPTFFRQRVGYIDP